MMNTGSLKPNSSQRRYNPFGALMMRIESVELVPILSAQEIATLAEAAGLQVLFIGEHHVSVPQPGSPYPAALWTAADIERHATHIGR